MTSQILREARKHEAVFEKLVDEHERPEFHLSARIGWMNDPNGVSYYDGRFHMFYQYHPYEAVWGPMHWGHAVSRDLLHWEYLPAALAPDELYDRNGCFSGGAIALPDGRHLLMYTGVVKEHGADGGVREVQTQCIAVGDGTDYEKYDQNPVLDERDLPKGASRYDFRDPKLWIADDGSYRCIAGNRPEDGSGQILMFASEDGFHWTFRKVFCENRRRFGKMWECPDFFELDGKGVLLTSPQDMLPMGFEYHNGNGTLCLIGKWDPQTETFEEEENQTIDYGIDFYAPQTVLAPDGRRIMIGWMQNWDTCGIYRQGLPWFGQMSLPRELSVRDGRLYQWPVRELEWMRDNRVSYRNVTFSGTRSLKGVSGRRIDMEVVVRPQTGAELYHKFALRFAQDGQYRTSLSFRPREAILKVDRKFSGSRRGITHQRRCKVRRGGQELKLRIILDRFSAEIFVNDGEQVMTVTMYTRESADGISFFSDGEVCIDVVKYDLV